MVFISFLERGRIVLSGIGGGEVPRYCALEIEQRRIYTLFLYHSFLGHRALLFASGVLQDIAETSEDVSSFISDNFISTSKAPNRQKFPVSLYILYSLICHICFD